jgi:RHH-type proline utilization regulon transcriptional repressor/proline dehydrogenase/delta 1-pyrroline-5-carboxylate dehydrogenase
VNREISGAVVVRHTFGGFKMVGFGTKAEGPDYLLHFMLSRCVPVSMVRSGFVPRAG